MEFTSGQQEAIRKMKEWWKSQGKQTFEISGWAGTGKSTIVDYLIKEIGLERSEVAFLTYTGKAALVLTRKGVPAQTIHSLIYEVREEMVKKKDKYGNDILNAKGEPVMEIKRFFRKVYCLPSNIKLIVVDECSMVSDDIWNDLLSFHVPMIVLGDPGQLPPIHGDSPLLKEPDVILTEIMRQQLDNPIIHLSILAREGKYINFGRYGKRVAVIGKDEITDSMLQNADIVLCGKNKTRKEINDHVRYNIYGRKSNLPELGDKVICRRNNRGNILDGIPLVNGLIGYCHNTIDPNEINLTEGTFRMDFRPEFIKDNFFGDLKCDLSLFDADREYGNKNNNNLVMKKNVEQFEFANGITIHLSQGSSWGKVLVFYEIFGDREFQRKVLYTAITRSEDLLILGR